MNSFILTNADTDSISFSKPDGSEFTQEEQIQLLNEINNIMPNKIQFEDDGYYSDFIVIKAKNYVLRKKGTDVIKYKGSSIKDQKKEPALMEMLKEILEDALIYKKDSVVNIYNKYIQEAINIQDISRWATKKSISETLLKSTRTNETKIVDAIKDIDYQIGDKVYLFNKIDGFIQKKSKGELQYYKDGRPKMVENKILCLAEKFDGNYDKMHYVSRVYKTIQILSNIINMEEIIDYSLNKNRDLLK